MGEAEVTLELAFELQKKADAEIESINPGGGSIYKESSFGINPLINVVLDNDGKYSLEHNSIPSIDSIIDVGAT